MRMLIAALALAATACTTTVSHPTRTTAQQRADINFCNAQGERKYPLDAVMGIAHAFDCLAGKGYKREGTGVHSSVKKAVGAAPPPPSPVVNRPCRVPCRSRT